MPYYPFFLFISPSLLLSLPFPLPSLQQEVTEMRTQISQSGVQVDVDAPKGQDLSLVMEEMRANYEKMALNNAKDLKVWHENQVCPSYLYSVQKERRMDMFLSLLHTY